MTNQVREALGTVCRHLNSHNVDYMIIGGAAVGYYGFARVSGGPDSRQPITDIDFWYKPTIENYLSLVAALDDIGVDTEELRNIIFDPKKTYLRVPHEGFKTEFLPQMSGLESYNDCKLNAPKAELDGNELHFLGYEDLLRNKEAVNREVDKIDIAELKKRNKPS